MKLKADLHIHSVLSPCADFVMTSENIIDRLVEKGVEVFSITDHNSCGNSRLFMEKSVKKGLVFIPGVEVQTEEEVHILAYFSTMKSLEGFCREIKEYLPDIKNREDIFGYQLILDKDDEYVEKEEAFLAGSISLGIDDLSEKVYGYGGIIVAAHIDKISSVVSNFGYIPDIKFSGIEIYKKEKIDDYRDKYMLKLPIISSSDAHFLDDIGEAKFIIEAESKSLEDVFNSLKKGEIEMSGDEK